ncbi:PREDICTED: sialic acid-binding Ig-like lectin 13 [Condylura cristata]|uniref:sialic acid-binding Ig-like lectin 13 n=1 Tax=Condylura cristata TaxID=143302 RepID=UPI0003347ADF|nr:PREDICTED: sialic acid-binding Ig-like lectin 13 [Condylura cristata]
MCRQAHSNTSGNSRDTDAACTPVTDKRPWSTTQPFLQSLWHSGATDTSRAPDRMLRAPSARGGRLLLLLLPLVWPGEPWGGAGVAAAEAVTAWPAGAQGLSAWAAGYRLRVQSQVAVQEGLCVRVPCSFSYPWGDARAGGPVYGYWFQRGASDVLVATNHPAKKLDKGIRPTFHLGDPAAHSCALYISSVRRTDSGQYYFRVESSAGRHSYKAQPLAVRVTALTQAPDIVVQQPLEAGRPSRLTCSLRGACAEAPPVITWTGAALRPAAPGREGHKFSELLLIPRPRDHGTDLTCRVSFPWPGVSTERTLRLDVSYAPQNLTVSLLRENCAEREYLGNGSSLSALEGESLRLLCATDSNPPARLSWAWGSGTPSARLPSDPGVLELPRLELGHEGEFTCHAQHPRGALHASLRLSVQSPPRLLGPSCSPEDDGGLLCLCSARARPAPALRWRLGEQLLAGNMKTCKKGAPQGKAAGRAAAPSTLGPASWVSQEPVHGTLEAPGPAPRASAGEQELEQQEEQELHYASLSFLSLRLWPVPAATRATPTEYSEIMARK